MLGRILNTIGKILRIAIITFQLIESLTTILKNVCSVILPHAEEGEVLFVLWLLDLELQMMMKPQGFQ